MLSKKILCTLIECATQTARSPSHTHCVFMEGSYITGAWKKVLRVFVENWGDQQLFFKRKHSPGWGRVSCQCQTWKRPGATWTLGLPSAPQPKVGRVRSPHMATPLPHTGKLSAPQTSGSRGWFCGYRMGQRMHFYWHSHDLPFLMRKHGAIAQKPVTLNVYWEHRSKVCPPSGLVHVVKENNSHSVASDSVWPQGL